MLSSELSQQAKGILLGLLIALPRDRLLEFHSQYFRLDKNLLSLLLRTRTRLTSLTFCFDENEKRELPGPTYVQGNFDNLQTLRIFIVGNNRETYSGLAGWLPHLFNLRSLHVEGQLTRPNIFTSWEIPSGIALSRVQSLVLADFYLSKSVMHISSLLDIGKLHTLELVRCTGAVRLLGVLADAYQKSGKSSLKCFTAIAKKGPGDLLSASEALFQWTRGLKHVVLSWMGPRLLDPSSLNGVVHLWNALPFTPPGMIRSTR